MDKAQKLRLVKDFNMSRSQKERLIKITNSENSNNEFDFKVYINGHEDLGQYKDYNNEYIPDIYGYVATDIINNINPLIFNILNNKLYIEIEGSEEDGFDITISRIRKKDNRATPVGWTTMSIERDVESGKYLTVLGELAINSEEDEKYLKEKNIIALCILGALEKIDVNHLRDALNKYPYE